MSNQGTQLPLSAAEHGTQKLYLDDYGVTSCSAVVHTVEVLEEGAVRIILDQTVVYPGGGGQACDLGVITWDGGSLDLAAVTKDVDGIILHDGTVHGDMPKVDQEVAVVVDGARRDLNSRLHSAGHLLDQAVYRAGLKWDPGKGAHYPHMSFVEYTSGEYDGSNSADYVAAIQREIDTIYKQVGALLRTD